MREPEGSFFVARNGGVLLKTIALTNQKGVYCADKGGVAAWPAS